MLITLNLFSNGAVTDCFMAAALQSLYDGELTLFMGIPIEPTSLATPQKAFMPDANIFASLKNQKRPLHTRVVTLLSAHAPLHLLLRLSTLLLHEGVSMYALQKHSAKIAFFYIIKKPFTQFFQQLIKILAQDRFIAQKSIKTA